MKVRRERRRTSAELRVAAEVELILRSSEFTVVRGAGRDRVRVDVHDLETAKAVAVEVGPDDYGREPMLYAITAGDRQSIHIDARHLAEIERRQNLDQA